MLYDSPAVMERVDSAVVGAPGCMQLHSLSSTTLSLITYSRNAVRQDSLSILLSYRWSVRSAVPRHRRACAPMASVRDMGRHQNRRTKSRLYCSHWRPKHQHVHQMSHGRPAFR